MHISIRSERQRRRALHMLLEVEALHLTECECMETCKMLRELREDIAELKGPPNNKKRLKCRDCCRPILLPRIRAPESGPSECSLLKRRSFEQRRLTSR